MFHLHGVVDAALILDRPPVPTEHAFVEVQSMYGLRLTDDRDIAASSVHSHKNCRTIVGEGRGEAVDSRRPKMYTYRATY